MGAVLSGYAGRGKSMKAWARSGTRRSLLRGCLLAWVLLVGAAALPAGAAAAVAAPPEGFYFIGLAGPDEGNADRREVADLAAAIRRDYPNGPRDLVVLIHGYDVRRPVAQEL